MEARRGAMNLKDWALACWQNAEDHGFHDEGVNNDPPSWVANLHGEVSELWEAYRRDKLNEQCDKPVKLTCAEEELADIMIRTMDVAVQMGIDIEQAVKVKHEYNVGRPYRHGGKRA
jgi:NTP pyrophosphatase (non-canonical NTP hydrolase)